MKGTNHKVLGETSSVLPSQPANSFNYVEPALFPLKKVTVFHRTIIIIIIIIIVIIIIIIIIIIIKAETWKKIDIFGLWEWMDSSWLYIYIYIYIYIKKIIKSVAYSSQGSHAGQLDFYNWLADSSTTG